MKKQTVFTLVSVITIGIIGTTGFIINNKEDEVLVAIKTNEIESEIESSSKNENINSNKTELESQKNEIKSSEMVKNELNIPLMHDIYSISEITDEYINQTIKLQAQIVSIDKNQDEEINIIMSDNSGTILLTIRTAYIEEDKLIEGTQLEIIGTLNKKDNIFQVIPENSASIKVLFIPKNTVKSDNEVKNQALESTEMELNSNELTSEHNKKIVTIEGVYIGSDVIRLPSGQSVNVRLKDPTANDIEVALQDNQRGEIVKITGIIESSGWNDSYLIKPISDETIEKNIFFGENVLDMVDISSLEDSQIGKVYIFRGIPKSITYDFYYHEFIDFYLDDQTGLLSAEFGMNKLSEEEIVEVKSIFNEASITSTEMLFEARLESIDGDFYLNIINYRNE